MSVPRYWREIPQRYNLQASRCEKCEAVHYPPRSICPTCRRESIGKIGTTKLSGRARIVEWTTIHKPATGYEDQIPYTLALLETVEGPRLVGQVIEHESITLREGSEVEAAFRRIGSEGDAGVIHYGIKWRPVRGATLVEETDSSEE